MEQLLNYRIDISEQSAWGSIRITQQAKRHLLHLQDTGLFYSGPGYYTTREGLDSYLIKLTLAGEGVLQYQGKQYALKAGDYFWIDCKKPQDYRTAPGAKHWHILWLHFNGVGAKEYYDLFCRLNQGSPVGHIPKDSPLVQHMDMLRQLYEMHADDIAVDIQSANLLSRLLTGLLSGIADPVKAVPTPAVTAVQAYIQENYNRSIPLESLAQRFHISKFYLQRTFSKFVGMSPVKYQQAIRLTKAKELLRTTDLPVNTVAEAVGFESTGAFITAFKKRQGITPLKYRALWIQHT